VPTISYGYQISVIFAYSDYYTNSPVSAIAVHLVDMIENGSSAYASAITKILNYSYHLRLINWWGERNGIDV
jgi:hypothetical protein